MNKILYLMHVDWGWIKQRPHFIASELSDKFKVDIFYPISKNRNKLTKNEKGNISTITGYIRLPHRLRQNKFFKKLSDLLIKIQINNATNIDAYDYIFVTHPEQINLIPNNFNGKIIYDCMDDHSEFDDAMRSNVEYDEKILCNKSDLILSSSSNLSRMLTNKYNLKKDIHIVFNAISSTLANKEIKKKEIVNNKIAYLGTISEWIDFELLTKVLEQHSNVKVDFIGPVTIDVPYHDRINFLGAVSHDELDSIMSNYSYYIMPFKINDLIRSVDPVKLYEYIYFGGGIISSYYPEIERFRGFVNFYNNYDDLNSIFSAIENDNFDFINLATIDDRIKFISENTWLSRVNQITKLMKELN